MRIKVTKTDLAAFPEDVWRITCEDLLDAELELTPIQEAASLCLRYYSMTIQGLGHLELAELYGSSLIDELAQALKIIGAEELSAGLVRHAGDKSEDGYAKADDWLASHSQELLDAIYTFIQANFDDFYEIVDEYYTMILPKRLARLGVIESALMFALMTAFAITNPDDLLLIVASFSSTALIGLVLIAYVLGWKADVRGTVMNVRLPLRFGKTIDISTISHVRNLRDRVVVYTGGRRGLSVSKSAQMYAFFIAQLYANGKIEDARTAGFTVRKNKAYAVVTGAFLLLFASGTIVCAIEQAEMPTVAFMAAGALVSLWFLVDNLLWQITVSDGSIAVRKALLGTRSYLVSEVTRFEEHDGYIELFVGGRRILRAEASCEGYPELAVRLRSLEQFGQDGLGEAAPIAGEGYTIRQPKSSLWLGIFASIGFGTPMVLSLVLNEFDESMLMMLLVFSSLTLAGLGMTANALLFKVTVSEDLITVSRPLRPKLSLRFDEISEAKAKGNDLTIYKDNKRLFTINKTAPGFDKFIKQL